MHDRRILVITGAGVSAESGIPTFRGKDGYWRNRDPAKLATPEAFARDPKLVWEWYRERRQRIRNAQPNAAHEAIAKLARHADEFLLVTQNVDDLHKRAGLPAEKMVQIHGDIFATRCSRCDFSDEGRGGSPEPPGSRATLQSGRLRSIAPTSDNNVDVPRCPECDAFMRPGVVWFGEQLDAHKIDIVEKFFAHDRCDYTIVIGTTALARAVYLHLSGTSDALVREAVVWLHPLSHSRDEGCFYLRSPSFVSQLTQLCVQAAHG